MKILTLLLLISFAPNTFPCAAQIESILKAGNEAEVAALNAWAQGLKGKIFEDLSEENKANLIKVIEKKFRQKSKDTPRKDREDVSQQVLSDIKEIWNDYSTNETYKGYKFEVFLGFRIRSAITDANRKLNPGTRSAINELKVIEIAINTLSHQLERPPTSQEIFEYIVSLPEYAEKYQVYINRVDHIDSIQLHHQKVMGGGQSQLTHGDDDSTTYVLDTIPGDEPELTLAIEYRELMEQILSVPMTDQQQRVIQSRYYQGLTFKEIGEQMGLTESRVCKIHTRLIKRLRERFRSSMEE